MLGGGQYRTAHGQRAGAVTASAAGSTVSNSAEVIAERKRMRELLTQIPELLKQMQAG